MGYPVNQNAPRITVTGKIFAVDAVATFGVLIVGVFELVNSEWNLSNSPLQSTSPKADVVAAGGIKPFIVGIDSALNGWFHTTFGASAPTFAPSAQVFPEPTDDATAQQYIMQALEGGTLTPAAVVIPPAMRAAYDSYWTAAIPVGSSVLWANGSITKMGERLAFYADPSGAMLALSPVSDLNAIAKVSKSIAAKWLADYNFVPV